MAAGWPLVSCLGLLLLRSELVHGAGKVDAPPNLGMFVAVGYGGRRITSRDGRVWENDQRWSDEAKDDDNVLFNVAYGFDRFIAVGGGARVGHLLSTRDGRTWTELPSVKGRVATIAFGRGRFVAGHDVELLVSTDGESFAPGAQLPWHGSIHPRRSACGDTEAGFRFVIIGDIDLYPEHRRVNWRAATADGTRFEHTELDTPAARDVAYGSGHFVVVGPQGFIASSHDGQTWEQHEVAAKDEFNRVVWSGSRFLISGGKTGWSSTDGLTWGAEKQTLPGGIAWAGEDGQAVSFSWGGNIHASDDLRNWRKLAVPAGPSLEAVAWGPLGGEGR